MNFDLIYDVNRTSRKNLLTENRCECLLFTLVIEIFACECKENLASYKTIVCRRRRRRLLGLVKDDDGPTNAKENKIKYKALVRSRIRKMAITKKKLLTATNKNSQTEFLYSTHARIHTAWINEIVFHTTNICICKHRQRATKILCRFEPLSLSALIVWFFEIVLRLSSPLKKKIETENKNNNRYHNTIVHLYRSTSKLSREKPISCKQVSWTTANFLSVM